MCLLSCCFRSNSPTWNLLKLLSVLALRFCCIFVQSFYHKIRILVKTIKRLFALQRLLAKKAVFLPAQPCCISATGEQNSGAGAARQWAVRSALHAGYLIGALVSAPASETLHGEFIKHRQCQGHSENPPGGPRWKTVPKGKAALLES